jgi:peptidoglycan hydrolase-like protein with peptidoglycan-binding domain
MVIFGTRSIPQRDLKRVKALASTGPNPKYSITIQASRMALRSELFTKDPAVKARLEACAARNSEHILFGAKGDHVSAIQAALFIILPGLQLPDEELSDKATGKGFYGPQTAAAVRRYKQNHKPPIINKSYQSAPDDIVGIMTIQFLDDDLVGKQPGPPPPPPPVPPPTNQEIIDKAFDRSRKSLPPVLGRLQNLANAINAANQLDGLQKIIAIQNLGRIFARDIAVIADKLKISSDPLAPEFYERDHRRGCSWTMRTKPVQPTGSALCRDSKE